MTLDKAKERAAKVSELNTVLFNSIACILYLEHQQVAQHVLNVLIAANVIEVNDLSVLDIAETYGIMFNGNSIEFLRVYQDYFGPIE